MPRSALLRVESIVTRVETAVRGIYWTQLVCQYAVNETAGPRLTRPGRLSRKWNVSPCCG
ncbi:hypothetical protein AGR7C_Cc230061 [Agrobacterium deltaense Zutra 3/1]|uniref:Uncharacterized protein n=1 Tax=Agrobacterium deltaense Zutra 3/1 TaxID=1183427 RepID=A0A1S7Q087_9HYPH|nr:hypothetical protein AGR7C_Cc230061 [Agrobacterium deltaense Zutra 3/1]